ncbi:hypothetical protein DM01DRAFT_1322476 [Hesseltinella vesiculosa]|uniref:Uncharacterized protein n=1 Tax=Hesseltinella vesiculosa TaxID=101127 RepID=A0A1X2GGT1_9FUNG|nr:hypothetical protein DM01DRAFT_1322476 [Hesseltinella vesiculosa]
MTLTVADLPLHQQKALMDMTSAVNDLFATYQKEYQSLWPATCDPSVLQDAPESVTQVSNGADALGLSAVSRFVEVESDYYSWEVQRRSFRVLAPSRAHMCKSLIMENTRCTHTNYDDPLYSRYYCIYDTPVNTQVLLNYARDLNNRTISKKHYNFRMADENVSYELTGYKSGGVCAIGMKCNVPIILAGCILQLNPPVMFLGAGHVDWKIGVPVQDFIDKTGCLVANLD